VFPFSATASWELLALVPVLGLIVGFLSGLFGIGGGFFLGPALHIFFGVPYPVAIGSSVLAIPVFSSIGLVSHLKNHHVHRRLALLTILFMLPGIALGALILHQLELIASNNLVLILNALYALVIVIAAFMMIKEYQRHSQTPANQALLHPGEKRAFRFTFKQALLGVQTGILSGLLGVGGGFILVPVFSYIMQLTVTEAIGTSMFVVVVSACITAAVQSINGNVDIALVMLIALSAAVGSFVAGRLTPWLRGKKLRLAFLAVLAIALIMLATSYLVP